MRDDICTIPVSEVFEENDGCPICRMYRAVEDHITDYIMGAAMMEPDVRMVTNKTGFCEKHFAKMMKKRGRLQLSLMIESHIDDINNTVLKDTLFGSKKAKGEKVSDITHSCFICDKIEWGMSRMIDTLYRCYENEMDFRKMFGEQKMFCLPHYERLVAGADKKKMRSYCGEFLSNITRITKEYSKELHSDIKKYTTMYDYRNNTENADWGNSRDAVERAVAFLTGAEVE